MNDDARRGLAALLENAGRAHHETIAASHGEDPEWTRWYAVWLQPRIVEFLPEVPPADLLAAELKALAGEHKRLAHGLKWPEFYARRLLDLHGWTDRSAPSA